MKKSKGFTLIELMIVVAIVGILVAMLLPRVTGLMDMARDSATAKNLKNLKAGIDWYMTFYGKELPRDQDTLIRYLETRFGTNLPRAQLRRGARIKDGKGSLDSARITHVGYITPPDEPHPPVGDEGGWIFAIIQDTKYVTVGQVAQLVTVEDTCFWVNSDDFDTGGQLYSDYGCM
jgi:prepilin-type N-terminal cleavage/methylation domain-containing protein